MNVFYCYHSCNSTEGGAYTEMHPETVMKVSCQNVGRNCALEERRLLFIVVGYRYSFTFYFTESFLCTRYTSMNRSVIFEVLYVQNKWNLFPGWLLTVLVLFSAY